MDCDFSDWVPEKYNNDNNAKSRFTAHDKKSYKVLHSIDKNSQAELNNSLDKHYT